MPISVIIAVAAGAASAAVGAGILGAVVGALTAVALSAVFARPETQGFADLASDRLLTVRQPIGPWQWIYGQTRVGGFISFMEMTESNKYLHMVVTLAGHECEEITEIWFDDELVSLDVDGNATGDRWSDADGSFVVIKISLGDEAAGVQPFPELVAASASKWTNDHQQTGRAKLYVRLEWQPEIFPNGIPQISCVVKGRKVIDPRISPTESAWSDNPALCIADYLMSDIGLAVDYSELDEAQLIAAANICDEQVEKSGSPTEFESRYTMNGALNAGDARREALEGMLTAINGKLRFIGGTWGIYPAVYQTPTITLGVDDLRGALHVMPRLSKRDLCNAVKGIYVSVENSYQPTDFPPVTNATYLTEDQEERLWKELDLPYTNSSSMAQRIAKIELEKTRQQITVEWPGKLGCYRLQPGDTVMLTLSRYGWDEKVFEVSASTLVFEEADGGVILGCDLVLRETVSTVFDWNSGEETTIDAAPDTNLPDPFSIDAPGKPQIEEELYETRGGRGIAAKAIMTWAASTDAFIDQYQPEFRTAESGSPSTAGEWMVLSRTTSLTAEILDIAPGVYDFRVKAVNVLGVSSDYATKLAQEVFGLGAAPSAPSGVALQAAGGLAIITMTKHEALDVRRGGRILVRHSELLTGALWENSLSIGNREGYGGDSVIIVLPLKSGTYLLKAEDSTGQRSAATLVSTKQATALTFSTVDTLQEDPTFSGTHDSTVVSGTDLTLERPGSPDGPVTSEGAYTFSAGFNFGSVVHVRITGEIEAAVENINDLFDSDELFDSNELFDGDADGSLCDAWLEARETDDPVGSPTPTWGEWKRLDAAEFECQAMELRLQMRSFDPDFNIRVSTLRAHADEVA